MEVSINEKLQKYKNVLIESIPQQKLTQHNSYNTMKINDINTENSTNITV